MPAWATEKARIVRDDHHDNVRRAIEAGVRVPRSAPTPGSAARRSNGEEFLVMQRLGLDALECIRSATTLAADTVGWNGEAGTLAPGAWGDVIGVPGDPLEHLELLAKAETVQLVVKGGEVVKERS